MLPFVSVACEGYRPFVSVIAPPAAPTPNAPPPPAPPVTISATVRFTPTDPEAPPRAPACPALATHAMAIAAWFDLVAIWPAAPAVPALAVPVPPAVGSSAPEIRSRLFAVMLLGNKETQVSPPGEAVAAFPGTNTYRLSGSISLRNMARTIAPEPPPPPPPRLVAAAPDAPAPPPAPAPIRNHEENLRPLGFLQI